VEKQHVEKKKKYVEKLHPLVLSLLLQKGMAVVLKLLLCRPLQETGGSKMDCLQSHQEELDDKVSFTCKISNTQSRGDQRANLLPFLGAIVP